MLKWEKIRPQNVIDKKHTRRELPLEQNRSGDNFLEKKTDHLPGKMMGPLPIIGRVSEDHWKIECSGDVRGLEYPRPAVDGEMKSSWVGHAPGCHRVVEPDDHPRVEKPTRCHELLQRVPLH